LDKQQNQIAEEMDVSITTVSRLLKRAKDERIIEFVIRDPYVECLKMGQKIKDVFGLREVVIAPAIDFSLGDDETAYDPESVKKLVALEGTRYLQRIIKEKDVPGVTWGSTIYQLINYLNPAQKVDATFVTLHGSLAYWWISSVSGFLPFVCWLRIRKLPCRLCHTAVSDRHGQFHSIRESVLRY